MDYREPMSGDTFAAFRTGDHVHLNMNGRSGTLSFVGARFIAAMLTEAAGPEPAAHVGGPLASFASLAELLREGDLLAAAQKKIDDLEAAVRITTGQSYKGGNFQYWIDRAERLRREVTRSGENSDRLAEKDREIKRLTARVTELQAANTREVEARRAAEIRERACSDAAKAEIGRLKTIGGIATIRAETAEKECGDARLRLVSVENRFQASQAALSIVRDALVKASDVLDEARSYT